jgi:hypothetical protein
LAGEVIVYADRVLMSSYTPKPVTVMIRDKGLAESTKTMFLALWDKAEKE